MPVKTPYQILEITVNSTDAEIKQAYLGKVKENPPDKDQEKFQLIHNAYISIKDLKSRTSYDLFTQPTADFDLFVEQALKSNQKVQITPDYFNKMLNVSVDETVFQNIFKDSE